MTRTPTDSSTDRTKVNFTEKYQTRQDFSGNKKNKKSDTRKENKSTDRQFSSFFIFSIYFNVSTVMKINRHKVLQQKE